jgi:erythromycin esterase-like protein
MMRRLIAEKGFFEFALEADRPDAYGVRRVPGQSIYGLTA